MFPVCCVLCAVYCPVCVGSSVGRSGIFAVFEVYTDIVVVPIEFFNSNLVRLGMFFEPV